MPQVFKIGYDWVYFCQIKVNRLKAFGTEQSECFFVAAAVLRSDVFLS